MSAGGYKYISWNRNKIAYDLFLLAGVAVYIYTFTKLGQSWWAHDTRINAPIVRMRAWGTCAFLMLTFILCIGPLARLDRRFAPVLYNRRHFGVLTFLVACWHLQMVLDWYYNFSAIAPALGALLSMQFGAYLSLTGFAFEAFGVGALVILLLMAVTSHDFWLKFLTPPVWKRLHMGVYAAYGLLVAHVALGALQSDRGAWLVSAVGASVVVVCVLHVVAGLRERRVDDATAMPARARTAVVGIPTETSPHWDSEETEWVDAGTVDDIEDNRARIVTLADGDRVAIFRYDGKISAIHNACAHQNGPLGEGRVIDGCVTCPWHGFQYDPHNGTSPPPFDEKVPTYRVRLAGRRVLLDPNALPPGTAVTPAVFDAPDTSSGQVHA